MMPLVKTIIKIILWIALAAILLFVGVLLGTVQVLKPEKLTPIVREAANKSLNAQVDLTNAQLRLRPSWPFLSLQLDSLSIVSNDIAFAPQSVRDSLPQWGDTLLRVRQISGGVNVPKLMVGTISLSKVDIVEPNVNVLIVNDELNSFSIVKPSEKEEEDTTSLSLPDLQIEGFEIKSPSLIRFADLSSGTSADVTINTVKLVGQNCEEHSNYQLDISTDIDSPLFAIIGKENVPVYVNGNFAWEAKRPLALKVDDLELGIAEYGVTVNADIDAGGENLVVNSANVVVKPIVIADLLASLPADQAKEWGIPAGIQTDASVGLSLSLLKPYALGADQLPYVDLGVTVPDSYLKWRQVDLRSLSLDATLGLRGFQLDSAFVNVEKLNVGGPATTLSISGKATHFLSDPAFEGQINGKMHLEKLPAQLTSAFLAPGDKLAGLVSLNASILGRLSMFTPNGFHQLRADGTVDLHNVLFQSADSQTMAYAHHAHAALGTLSTITTERQSRRDSTKSIRTTADSLLTASISLDSSRIRSAGVGLRIKNFKIGVGAQNRALSSDTTSIIPIGGGISIGSLSFFNVADTAGARIRNLKGQVSLKRYRGDAHLPLFTLDAKLERVSAGSNSTRMMLKDASLNARLNLLPDSMLSASRLKLRNTVDSIRRMHPDLHPDTIYDMAQVIMRKSATRRNRASSVNDEMELLDWGATEGMRRILLDWRIRGRLNAQEARLFTTAFPVPNSLKNINLKFTNDSVSIHDVAYKAGHSDFTISGNISNIKRALTSRRGRQPIKIDFSVYSDTLNVNELANAFFTGAANSGKSLGASIADDDADEADLAAAVEPADTTSGPLLIPVNIDAKLKMRASNVLYSNILLHNFEGDVMAYDGALNLSNLSASSDVGSVAISGLYSAPTIRDMKFGMSLDLNRFKIKEFLQMMPAIDSIMPLLRDFGGIINAKIAATSDVDSAMNLVIPTLSSAINLSGDSLVVLDPETFKFISKWLMFKDKNKNMIDHMSVDLVVENNHMMIYPFMFDFDRYRLGVQGDNDLEMNYNYHVSVLKSPLPFKFGINIKGNPDNFKVRIGRARFNEKQAVANVALADTARVNLINQFENIFRRGVRNSEFAKVRVKESVSMSDFDASTDTISSADSLYFRNHGLMP